MNVIALDPGTTHTAYVVYDIGRAVPMEFGKLANADMLKRLDGLRPTWTPNCVLAVEMIASYGKPVGAEIFETCVWIGRYIQAWMHERGRYDLVYRREVKLEICDSARAKDGNVRQALIDRWGGKDAAIGKKATPGPLYGMKADVWAALGVAVTWSAKHPREAA